MKQIFRNFRSINEYDWEDSTSGYYKTVDMVAVTLLKQRKILKKITPTYQQKKVTGKSRR